MARGATIMVNARIVDLRRDAIDISRFMPPPVFAMMTIAGAHVSAAAGLVHDISRHFAPIYCPRTAVALIRADRDLVRRKNRPARIAQDTRRQIEEQRYSRIDERAGQRA